MPRINEANLEEHRKRTMNALLDSAETIMREQGSDALTPAAVSKGAGIARNSIYRYVRDMRDLRRKLMDRHMPEWIETLERALEGISDPADVVTTWVRVNLEQAVAQGHDWMTRIPLDDAEEYSENGELWRQRGDGRAGEDGESGQDGQDDSASQEGAETSSVDNSGAAPTPETTQDTQDTRDKLAANDPFCTKRGVARSEGEQPSDPKQLTIHQRVNAPIVRAWNELSPSAPKVGISLTEGIVSSGMRLLSGKNVTAEKRDATIDEIERSTRAVIETLREDK
ncbi:TetR/AcrR family transcriptional regulator [Bifidobacterium sp. ESL0790]|uniref:TetR/AcrR family transcriptional regulator n=1 Tax=Bifidobacterium sp. ESL0790 TaxID=2983233 RepID=UPI0023F79858|nr:TetR/AcrR family transcriptional regulator [Bifidobacterium sp. ESL0790]WEV72356.1 TetR/AcrR family transcriptional regulator [Bifidobacterium sp. ESL0790]